MIICGVDKDNETLFRAKAGLCNFRIADARRMT
jgi:hypothetical protein